MNARIARIYLLSALAGSLTMALFLSVVSGPESVGNVHLGVQARR